jgi:hypothetical protein
MRREALHHGDPVTLLPRGWQCLPVSDPFAYFAGTWTIDRRIRDARSGAGARFAGTGRFMPVPGGLDYEESGSLRTGEAAVDARQAYRYRFDPGDRTGRVLFPDGRLFHPLSLETGLCRAIHPCGPDLYRGLIAIRSAETWCAVWWVTGPRKALRLATTFRRGAVLVRE